MERLCPIFDLIDGKGAVIDELFMLRQKGQSCLDESGNITLDDKHLHGREYAEALTYNSDLYYKSIRDKLVGRCDDRIDELMGVLSDDLRSYKRNKSKTESSFAHYLKQNIKDVLSKIGFRHPKDCSLQIDPRYRDLIDGIERHIRSFESMMRS